MAPPPNPYAKRKPLQTCSTHDRPITTTTSAASANRAAVSQAKRAPVALQQVKGSPSNNSLALSSKPPSPSSGVPKSAASLTSATTLTSASAPASLSQPPKQHSLKAKLKQQIQEIKRAQLLEQQKRQLRKEQKEQEKKQKMEQERLWKIQQEQQRTQLAQREERERQELQEKKTIELARQRQLEQAQKQWIAATVPSSVYSFPNNPFPSALVPTFDAATNAAPFQPLEQYAPALLQPPRPPVVHPAALPQRATLPMAAATVVDAANHHSRQVTTSEANVTPTAATMPMEQQQPMPLTWNVDSKTARAAVLTGPPTMADAIQASDTPEKSPRRMVHAQNGNATREPRLLEPSVAKAVPTHGMNGSNGHVGSTCNNKDPTKAMSVAVVDAVTPSQCKTLGQTFHQDVEDEKLGSANNCREEQHSPCQGTLPTPVTSSSTAAQVILETCTKVTSWTQNNVSSSWQSLSDAYEDTGISNAITPFKSLLQQGSLPTEHGKIAVTPATTSSHATLVSNVKPSLVAGSSPSSNMMVVASTGVKNTSNPNAAADSDGERTEMAGAATRLVAVPNSIVAPTLSTATLAPLPLQDNPLDQQRANAMMLASHQAPPSFTPTSYATMSQYAYPGFYHPNPWYQAQAANYSAYSQGHYPFHQQMTPWQQAMYAPSECRLLYPEASPMAIAQYAASQRLPQPPPPRPRPQQPKPVLTELLAEHPMESPSPFAQTHVVLQQDFVIVKTKSESFGIMVTETKESVLVDPDWPLAKQKPSETNRNDMTTSATCPASDSPASVPMDEKDAKAPPGGGNAQKTIDGNADSTFTANHEQAALSLPQAPRMQPKKRRKRVFFLVMTIQNADVQNARLSQSQHLLADDIILSVNGQQTGGKSFKDACALFATSGDAAVDIGTDCFRCVLKIARKKPKPEPTKSVQLNASSISAFTPSVRSSSNPFTPVDLAVFAVDVLMKAMGDLSRVLGRPLSEDIICKYNAMVPHLGGRDITSLKTSWLLFCQRSEKSMVEAANEFWRLQWQKESSTPASNLTDAQLASMRSAARPAKGCKCGSKDHEYVSHPSCVLYSDLRALSSRAAADPQGSEIKKKRKDAERSLNTVETAFKERILKLQSEQKAVEEEALFVQEMEDLQVQKLGKAVFSPSLTTIVLSAITELQKEFPRVTVTKEESAEVEEEDDEDDFEDDVPLSALGKRQASNTGDPAAPNKQQKSEQNVNQRYLATLLRLISCKWGHLYREPDHAEYAWRWEIFHGSNGGSWDAHSRNPRRPGFLTYENLQFVLTPDKIASLDNSATEKSLEQLKETQKLLAYLLSPTRSGVYDELLALVRLGGIFVRSDGIPELEQNWYEHVDLSLLEEMRLAWDPRLDRSGKFCVADKIRKALCKEWIVDETGWALQDDPDNVVMAYDEWEVWRAAFEEKQEAKSNDVLGIGKFGL